ncbi:PAP2 family protein [Terrimonas sp.]|uniref:phosphatase PAP2 family protein n=1 Tax=Terrimonas sp. TaxID=1914338 RepID=UPI000D516E8E|nr:phosphatase PAP2 family protein [Terrimonas sp.]PVD52972.1 PAP2 family protein [Terrimonas sp.]
MNMYLPTNYKLLRSGMNIPPHTIFSTAFILLWLLCIQQSFAQEKDSIILKDYKKGFFNSKAVRISTAPVILFAGSALTWNKRTEIRKLRNRYIPTFRNHYDDYFQYVPAVSVFALNAAGVKGKHTVKRAAVSYFFSAAVMAIAVNSIKYTAKVERPDGSTKNSFPSGHTANSFMNATFLNEEYGTYRHPLYGVAGYTMATATAIGRQLNNRHWISDVLAGAGIGILSTKVGYIIADHVLKDRGIRAPLRNNPLPVDDKPSFLEMRAGFAVATSKDLTANASELHANRGFNMGVEGAWFFHKNFGVGGEFAFSSFPMDDRNVIFNDPAIEVIGDGHYTQPMGIRYLHAGPYFSIPLTHNWFITGKLNAGTSAGAKGDIMLILKEEFQEAFESNELTFFQYKPETAFSWSTGLGIQKRIARNLGIKAYGNYFASKHDFRLDIIDDVDTDGKFTYKTLSNEKVKFNNFTFGLALTAYLW